jgi:hypothetical protein
VRREAVPQVRQFQQKKVEKQHEAVLCMDPG